MGPARRARRLYGLPVGGRCHAHSQACIPLGWLAGSLGRTPAAVARAAACLQHAQALAGGCAAAPGATGCCCKSIEATLSRLPAAGPVLRCSLLGLLAHPDRHAVALPVRRAAHAGAALAARLPPRLLRPPCVHLRHLLLVRPMAPPRPPLHARSASMACPCRLPPNAACTPLAAAPALSNRLCTHAWYGLGPRSGTAHAGPIHSAPHLVPGRPPPAPAARAAGYHCSSSSRVAPAFTGTTPRWARRRGSPPAWARAAP